MVQFVLDRVKDAPLADYDTVNESFTNDVINYANFLSQPLTLGMFVPISESGEVLREPMYDPANEQYWASEQFQFEQAQQRLLFEGLKVLKNTSQFFIVEDNLGNWIRVVKWKPTELTIDDLSKQCSATLTDTAIKIIYGEE